MEKFQKFIVRLFFLAIVIGSLGFSAWCWGALAYSYSKGERTGYVQKLSKRGWLFKTWEGELAMVNIPGTLPQIFSFSIRGDDYAKAVESTMGRRVAVQYEEHRGVPIFFGETRYFVVGVRSVDDIKP